MTPKSKTWGLAFERNSSRRSFGPAMEDPARTESASCRPRGTRIDGKAEGGGEAGDFLRGGASQPGKAAKILSTTRLTSNMGLGAMPVPRWVSLAAPPGAALAGRSRRSRSSCGQHLG